MYIYDNKQPLSLTIVPGHIKSHVAKKDKTGSVDYCRSVAESSWSSTFPAISLHLQTFGSCLSTARIKEVASAAGTSVLMHSLESSMHEWRWCQTVQKMSEVQAATGAQFVDAASQGPKICGSVVAGIHHDLHGQLQMTQTQQDLVDATRKSVEWCSLAVLGSQWSYPSKLSIALGKFSTKKPGVII